MTVLLKPLFQAAAVSLDRFWMQRVGRDLGILVPEYIDPGLCHRIEGALPQEETESRRRLAEIGHQMRQVGIVEAVSAALATGGTDRRRAALVALAGGAAWTATAEASGQVEIHCRPAQDGGIYLLATQPDRGAAHAPHAVCGYVQRLWLLAPEHPCADGLSLPAEPPALHAEADPDSLSLDAALCDVARMLRTAGAEGLAGLVEALRPCTGSGLGAVAAPKHAAVASAAA